jgi:Spy/CpxP family protein refolding chaperone
MACPVHFLLTRSIRKEVRRMKKSGIAGIVVLTIVLSVAAAYAFGPCWGGSGGWASGPWQGYNTLTPEQKAKVDQFWTDVSPLRQQMFTKRSEMLALMAQPAPDWNAIQQKRIEMAGLRTQIQKRAFDLGLPQMYGGFGGPRGMGTCGGPCRMGFGPAGGMMRGWNY